MKQSEMSAEMIAWLFGDTELDPDTNTTRNEG